MNTCVIRSARIEDAAAVAMLSAELGYKVETSEMEKRLTRIFREESSCIFVAEYEATIVGWIHASMIQLVESPFRAEIGGLVVSEKMHRKGVGRQLIEAVRGWAIAEGAEELSVKCNVTRADAHHFYEAMGFRRVKSQIVFRLTV